MKGCLRINHINLLTRLTPSHHTAGEEGEGEGDVRVWTACLDGRVRMWLADASAGGAMRLGFETDLGAPVTCLALLPLGTAGDALGGVALAGCAGGGCALLREDGTIAARFAPAIDDESEPSDVRSVAAVRGGLSLGLAGEAEELTIFTGDASGTICAWRHGNASAATQGEEPAATEVPAFTPVRQLRGHNAAVISLSFSPAGVLVSGAHDGTLRVWDAAASRPLYAIAGHTAYLGSVVADGERILADGACMRAMVSIETRSTFAASQLCGHVRS